jgi:hypothetical protein
MQSMALARRRNSSVLRWILLTASLLGLVLWTSPVVGQALSIFERPWTGSVIRPAGGPVVPIYDGWYQNPDGTYTLCFGYYSVNSEEDLTIPLGPDNFIEPREYDGLQPDYFERIPERPFAYRRRYCAFSVRVPETFTENDEVVWTLRRGRGEVLTVPGRLTSWYVLDEPRSPGMQNTAPVLRIEPDGPAGQGRNGVFAGPVRARVGVSLELSVSIDHEADELWVGWAKHQGPADVAFSEQNTMTDSEKRASTRATFAEPGEYLIRVQTIDSLADLEFFCCWTNGYIRVIVD